MFFPSKYPLERNHLSINNNIFGLFTSLPCLVSGLILLALPLQIWNGTLFPEQTGRTLFAAWCITMFDFIYNPK